MKNKFTEKPKKLFWILSYKSLIIAILFVLLTSAAIFTVTYSTLQHTLRSNVVYQALSNYKAQSLFYFMHTENHHFSHAFEEDFSPPPLSSVALQLATNIRVADTRSLFGSELPGFSIFDSHILLAGEGTDYTTIPHESAPPLESISGERDLDPAESKTYEESKKQSQVQAKQSTGDRKVVYIYHTHSWESYFPLLGMQGEANENKAVDNKTNITLVGQMLGMELKADGIGSEVDTTNMTQKLNEKGWGTGRAYMMSRNVVETALQQNKDVDYLIDIHRDSLRQEKTTAAINGTSYAKMMIVLGEANPKFDENVKMAKAIHEKLEEKYPGLSRGVLSKKKTSGNNGLYNQDLSDRSILIEVGGVDNNMEELTNTVKAFSDVFSEYYWQAEKVNAQ
ncbi:stage II sporulation protein P [Priestia megaterium]|uniref:stage II sporulation protein P n=1 Tax=Priestia megaterium TaxID=1404 RepID=UPI00211BCF24|nr:stage II sporulation protein P [Priestia megaterium]MDH3157274.1 stage II sporulation protein P [Priestia megaterium]MED4112321.1 stage II sporulation protein P [Priestia megaterium]